MDEEEGITVHGDHVRWQYRAVLLEPRSGRTALDLLLAKGWEPFAVTYVPARGLDVVHLRRVTPPPESAT